MCRSKISLPSRAIAAALALAAALTGCSDLYMDRRDSIALSVGSAVNANAVAQMYDPWPARSGNVNYGANGQRMQSAVERYRTNVVTAPVAPMALQTGNPSPATAQAPGSQTATATPASTATPAATPGSPTTPTTTVSSGQ
jgi:hypothetical protein